MALNSINTNISAYFAQSNIGKASTMSSSSIARLSGGDRIVRAADDVAAMSAGTSLQTNVTTLRMALVNTSQGSSLLQVADGALQQITDILQRQKAIAVQAGSGSLTSSERSFLNQEFQNLTEEIDRLADQTNFNGVELLNGALFEVTEVELQNGAAPVATASLTIADNTAGKKVIINGVTFTANAAPTGNQFQSTAAGVTLSDSVQSLANVLNASTDVRISAATYRAVGTTLVIESRQGGQMAELFTIDTTAANSDAIGGFTGKILTDAAGATKNTLALETQNDIGISRGDTTVVGTIGDSIVTTQAQTAANLSINFSNAVFADFADTKTVTFDDGFGGTIKIELDNNSALGGANNVAADISGATTVEEAIDAIAGAINTYSGTAGFVLDQLEATRDGTVLTIARKDSGNVLTAAGAAIAATATTIANTTITGSTTLANGADTGVNVSGITNSAFVGTISGFEATFTGTVNRADISVTVGDRTYTASNVNTTAGTVAAPSVTRFFSETGDFFDVGLTGATVNNQSDADTLATRLDKAFSTLTIRQDREIASYDAAGDIFSEGTQIGSLTGTSFELRSATNGDVQIDNVSVNAPLTGETNGYIEFVINGETYRSAGNIGSQLNAGTITQFASLSDPSNVLTFRAGATTIQFNTKDRAAAVEQAFTNAFGIGEGGESLNFQVGVTTSDTLAVSIGTVTTEEIFGGQTLDVLTKESAAAAADALDAAIDAVTAVRAEVGALQSRFDFAAANVESAIQNQDAARGVLLDTDIASESTAFATAQVQLQAGISVLAQANLQPQNLLKLIG